MPHFTEDHTGTLRQYQIEHPQRVEDCSKASNGTHTQLVQDCGDFKGQASGDQQKAIEMCHLLPPSKAAREGFSF